MSGGCCKSSSPPRLPSGPSDRRSSSPHGGSGGTASPPRATPRPGNKGCGIPDSSLRCTTRARNGCVAHGAGPTGSEPVRCDDPVRSAVGTGSAGDRSVRSRPGREQSSLLQKTPTDRPWEPVPAGGSFLAIVSRSRPIRTVCVRLGGNRPAREPVSDARARPPTASREAIHGRPQHQGPRERPRPVLRQRHLHRLRPLPRDRARNFRRNDTGRRSFVTPAAGRPRGRGRVPGRPRGMPRRGDRPGRMSGRRRRAASRTTPAPTLAPAPG